MGSSELTVAIVHYYKRTWGKLFRHIEYRRHLFRRQRVAPGVAAGTLEVYHLFAAGNGCLRGINIYMSVGGQIHLTVYDAHAL